jgi:hypothetical protein
MQYHAWFKYPNEIESDESEDWRLYSEEQRDQQNTTSQPISSRGEEKVRLITVRRGKRAASAGFFPPSLHTVYIGPQILFSLPEWGPAYLCV